MVPSLLAPQYSVSLQNSKDAAQDSGSEDRCDLISFIGLVQKLGIRWQSTLKNLGLGGSAIVSQALVNVETSTTLRLVLR